MTDMTAFERQLSGEIAGLMGPVRSVDDLAIYESVTAANRPQRWGFTMFSALRFVAAGVVVALFGGFLLAGVLTAPQPDGVVPAAVTESPAAEATSTPTDVPDPSVHTEILPGVELTVQEVEPGVYRVVDDGVRILASKNNRGIVAGHDGGLWVVRLNTFFRLGSDTAYEWAITKPLVFGFEVGPDGTVWTDQSPREGTASIQSFDGEGWTTQKRQAGLVDMTLDGTVWAVWEDPEQEFGHAFGYLDADGWQVLGEPAGAPLVAGPDDIWAIGGLWASYAHRFVDGTWQHLVAIEEGTEGTWEEGIGTDGPQFGLAGLGPDGTFWGIGGGDGDLVRFDGSEWSRWPLEDSGIAPGSYDSLGVAADGSVWLATGAALPEGFRQAADPGGTYEPTCDGIGHFDGVTWDRYLPDRCVDDIDVAADGSVWAIADKGLYVIAPEAVAAAE